MRLAIIILNYRTPELTIDCLASLEGQLEADQEQAVVVDNDSGDDSADRIEVAIRQRGWSTWARVLRAPHNEGFAAGNNWAIRRTHAEFYLLLNSDTLVPSGTIRGLLKTAEEHPDAGLLGPSCEEGDGRWSPSCFRDFHPVSELVEAAATGPVTRLLSHYDVQVARMDQPQAVDWIGFACVLIRREVLQQVGMLDEGFFMYFEDADYCRRVRETGWRVMYWPQLRIVHLMGASSQISSRPAALKRRPRYYYAARTRYYWKHYGRMGLLSANLLWWLGRTISVSRELIGQKQPHIRPQEWRDIWTDFLRSFPTDGAPNEEGNGGPI